jgi:hypothetical protein
MYGICIHIIVLTVCITFSEKSFYIFFFPSGAQALVSLKKYMPPPLPYVKEGAYMF